MAGYLRDYHGESLEKYIDRVIRPPPVFKTRMNEAVDKVVQYLHQMPDYRIKEVVKSGSLGKGTSVEDNADVDLVVFLEGYTTMESLIAAKPRILKDIKQYMCEPNPSWYSWIRSSRPVWMDSIRVLRITEFHIEFLISVPYNGRSQPVYVDILPAIDVISMQGDMKAVYREMQNKPEYVRSHYSVCFCKAQKELMRPVPSKVKDLIRLLKHWKKHNGLSSMKSYSCEVIGLYLFDEHLGKRSNFDMKTGFNAALELLATYEQLNISIPSFYAANDWSSFFPKKTYIMDPVNPFSNIAAWDVSKIKRCAVNTLQALLGIPTDGSGLTGGKVLLGLALGAVAVVASLAKK